MKEEQIKLCNQCKKRKRYINLSFCFFCYKQREMQKREEKKQRKKERHLNSKTYQKSEYKRLSKQAWHLFSLYVRTKVIDFQGFTYCYTCGIRKHYSELQAGHCFHKGSGRYKALDFDERNIKQQCIFCNKFKHGMGAEFVLKLVQEYGIEVVEEMKRRRQNEMPLSNDDLKEIINKFKKE